MTRFQQWWSRRTDCDSDEYACLKYLFVNWIDDALADLKRAPPGDLVKSAPFDGSLDSQIRERAIAYLEEQTLKPSTDDLAKLTDGLLGEDVTGDAQLIRLDELPVASIHLELLIKTHVALVTAYYFLGESEPNSPARLRTIEQFYRSTLLPAERVTKKRLKVRDGDNQSFANVFAIAFDKEVSSFISGNRSWINEIPATFSAALGQIVWRVRQKTAEEWAKERNSTSAPGTAADQSLKKLMSNRDLQGQAYEDQIRKHLREANRPRGIQSLSSSGSNPESEDDGGRDISNAAAMRSLASKVWEVGFGSCPELFDALYPIAWKSADGCTNEAPRQLLQLMLGAVSHKKTNSKPWSQLPWGVQPELIQAVIQKFTRNFMREAKKQINRRMKELLYERSIADALIEWLSRQANAHSINDPAIQMATQEMIDTCQSFYSNTSADQDASPVTDDDSTESPQSMPGPLDDVLNDFAGQPGWEQFKNVAKGVATNLVRRVQYEVDQTTGGTRSVDKKESARQDALRNLGLAPPDGLVISDLSDAASQREQLEEWLELTTRVTVPTPDQVAWVAKTLWETQQPPPNPPTKKSEATA